MSEEIEASKLTQEERDSKPSSLFAVPETRQLPIHDITHTKMAWNMVDNTKGLSDEQRARAKQRILRRAHKLGMDTSKWNVSADEMQAAKESEGNEDCDFDASIDFQGAKESVEINEQIMASFSAMSVNLPTVPDHPNRVPFSGVLTRIDEPSDNPLGGSNGKRVLLPKAVAEEALPSLLNMAIDFKDDLAGHDPQQKIGLITGATIVGNEIQIEGFFYGADFPEQVKHIQAVKSRLGFSFEAQVATQSMNDDPLLITHCVFTGAAVLYKDKAAYMSTSLSANADEENKMSNEILDAIEALNKRFEGVEGQIKEVKASSSYLHANSTMCAMVQPHADSLRAAAENMAKGGIGLHAENGHVRFLHAMANSMMAEASQGKMPHAYQTSDWYSASSAHSAEASKASVSAAAESESMKALKDELESLKTKMVDAEKARFAAAAEPLRRALAPEVFSLAKKAYLQGNAEQSENISVEALDKILAEKKIPIRSRFAQKLLMSNAGLLEVK